MPEPMTRKTRSSRIAPGMAEAPGLLDTIFAPPEVSLLEVSSALGADGHRARMRARLLAAGPEALADHEMLEMVLFLVLPRRNTKPIAKMLLARFNNFGGVIAASSSDLMCVEGLGEAGTAALKLVHAAAVRLVKGAMTDKPLLSNWETVRQYLLAALAHEKVEQFRVLFLDNRNRLLADEMLSRGTIDRTPVFPREIVRCALELHAKGVILVHNHPSGEFAPSRDDVLITKTIKKAVDALDIELHDHLIVAGDRIFSFKDQIGL
jgi:DNA repair protein RadC